MARAWWILAALVAGAAVGTHGAPAAGVGSAEWRGGAPPTQSQSQTVFFRHSPGPPPTPSQTQSQSQSGDGSGNLSDGAHDSHEHDEGGSSGQSDDTLWGTLPALELFGFVVAGLIVLVGAATILHSRATGNAKADNSCVVLAVVCVVDFVTDLLFLFGELGDYPVLQLVSGTCLAVAFLCNTAVVFRFLHRQRSQESGFREWLDQVSLQPGFIVIILLSSLHVEVLALLSSHQFSDAVLVTHGPRETKGHILGIRSLLQLGIFGILFEDIVQLAVQAAFLSVEGATVVSVVTLTFTVLATLFSIIRWVSVVYLAPEVDKPMAKEMGA